MAGDPHRIIVAELLTEFVEERVRQLPTRAFGVGDVTQAASTMLREAGVLATVRPTDEQWIATWLDQHPFLLKQKAGFGALWKPGLNKGRTGRA